MPKEREKRKNRLKECGDEPHSYHIFAHRMFKKTDLYAAFSEITIFFEKKLDIYDHLCIINVEKVRNFLTQARLRLKLVDFADKIVRTPERRML